MRTIRLLLLVLGVALVQIPDSVAQPRYGFGVGLSNNHSPFMDSWGLYSGALYVPLNFGTFRVEPEFSLFRLKEESTFSGGGQSQSQTDTWTILQFGTGAFYNLRPFEHGEKTNGAARSGKHNTELYGGLRLGIQSWKSSESQGNESFSSTQSYFYVGPAIGAEHMLGKCFSIGAEGRLTLITGSYTEGSGTFSSEFKETGIFTSAAVMLRAYLN